MSHKVKTFQNETYGKLRAAVIKNEPWLFASDICKLFKLSTNVAFAIKNVDSDFKMTYIFKLEDMDNNNGGLKRILVNEYGLIEMMDKINTKFSKEYEEWVHDEVISSMMQNYRENNKTETGIPEVVKEIKPEVRVNVPVIAEKQSFITEKQVETTLNNPMSIFKHEKFGKIRTLEIAGELWFIGKDVAVALGFVNTKGALSVHVDEEDKYIIQRSATTTFDIPNRGMTIINESGLYSLVFSSKLPDAKEFKHWVTSEVIPSIRKHGAYMTPETIEKTLTNPDFIIQLATRLKEEQEGRKIAEEKANKLTEENVRLVEDKEKLQETKKQLEETIETDKPKVEFADRVMDTNKLISIGQFAKLVEQRMKNNSGKTILIGRNKMCELLRKMKIFMNDNTPYQRYMYNGLFEVTAGWFNREYKLITRITGKGQVWLLEQVMKYLNEHELGA